MKRIPTTGKDKSEPRSRRAFLLSGGAVVTGLAVMRGRPSAAVPRPDRPSEKIRAIMNRYGSELGKARFA
jgi:hypothetical protein